jgi:hypothetical protein
MSRIDFGPVLLGRTLDADTSEHDLQNDMTTVTPRDMLQDHNWAAGGGPCGCQEGGLLLQGQGLAIQVWQTNEGVEGLPLTAIQR